MMTMMTVKMIESLEKSAVLFVIHFKIVYEDDLEKGCL